MDGIKNKSQIMGKHTFRMSDKKLKELRDEQEKQLRDQKRKEAILNAPLFGRATKPAKTSLSNKVPAAVVEKRSNPNSMMGLATKKAAKIYSGDKILGLATMHKSNIVPIFNEQAAIDVAQMRRN